MRYNGKGYKASSKKQQEHLYTDYALFSFQNHDSIFSIHREWVESENCIDAPVSTQEHTAQRDGFWGGLEKLSP